MNHRDETFEILRRANPIARPYRDRPVPMHPRRPRVSFALAGVVATIVVVLGGLFLWAGRSTLEPTISAPATAPNVSAAPNVSTPPPGRPVSPLPTLFVLEDGTELARTAGDSMVVSDGAYEHVVDRALADLLNDRRLGETPDDRHRAVFGCAPGQVECVDPLGGLKVVLTIDFEVQAHAQAVYDTWLGEPQNPSGEIVLIDNETGAVLAWIAPTTAVVEPRPAGTLNHSITTIAALEAGIGLESMWDATSPVDIDSSDGPIVQCVNAGGDGSGEMSLYLALVRSVDTVHCQVASEVGLEAVERVAQRLDHSAGDIDSRFFTGSNQVTGLGVAEVYVTIANFGTGLKPHVVGRVVSPSGDVLLVASADRTSVLDPGLAAAVHRALSEVPTVGTAPRANLGVPQGGKTGLVSGFTGAWYAGYTPELTAVVWVGFPDQSPMTNVEIRGQMYSRVFGGSVAAPMWAEVVGPFVDPAATFPSDPTGVDDFFLGG